MIQIGLGIEQLHLSPEKAVTFAALAPACILTVRAPVMKRKIVLRISFGAN